MDQELTSLLTQQAEATEAIRAEQRRQADTLTIMSRMLADVLEILTPGTPEGESGLERLLAQLVAQGKEQLALLRQHGQLMARIERGADGRGDDTAAGERLRASAAVMINFRKLAVAQSGGGQIMRKYFTENTPEPAHDPAQALERQPDAGGRMTAYYTSRDSRATWRPDMPAEAAQAAWHQPAAHAARRRTGPVVRGAARGQRRNLVEARPEDQRLRLHRSAAQVGQPGGRGSRRRPPRRPRSTTPSTGPTTPRCATSARELGWARKGAGGEDGADPGAVGWVSFRHHVARPTLPVQDGPDGATYLANAPVDGDPHTHIHNAMFNMVATESGRVGSLDTQRLHVRVHEFGAYFQARLADELRRLGIGIGYNRDEQAVVVTAVPQIAVDTFSKSTRQVLGNARAFAKSQGLVWDELSAERKIEILSEAGVAARLAKHGPKTDREIWTAQAKAIGWEHASVLAKAQTLALTDEQRIDKAYRFAARHLATEFKTAAVLDHEKLRLYAARGLIGTGIAGGIDDIDRVVERIEQKGIRIGREHVALVVGMTDGVVRVTNTAQIRIEEEVGRRAREAALDRSVALPTEAVRAAIDASGLGGLGEPEHWGSAEGGDLRHGGGRRTDAAHRRRRLGQDHHSATAGGGPGRRTRGSTPAAARWSGWRSPGSKPTRCRTPASSAASP